MADPVATFLENSGEVQQLVEFHEEKTGTKRGIIAGTAGQMGLEIAE